MHTTAVPEVDPGGHTYPAVQFPEHDDDPRPDVAPNVPAGQAPVQALVFMAGVAPNRPVEQLEHTPAPDRLKVPTGQGAASGDTEPATHAYPGVQAPVHDGEVKPGVEPNSPAAQSVQAPAAPREYVPTGQMAGVADTDPDTQKYPAAQEPEQPAVDKPVPLPNNPAGHGAVHALVVRPELEPKVPALQLVHAAAPAPLY